MLKFTVLYLIAAFYVTCSLGYLLTFSQLSPAKAVHNSTLAQTAKAVKIKSSNLAHRAENLTVNAGRRVNRAYTASENFVVAASNAVLDVTGQVRYYFGHRLYRLKNPYSDSLKQVNESDIFENLRDE